MNDALLQIIVAAVSGGAGLGAAVKLFGFIFDFLKHKMDSEREDAGQIFRQSLEFIEAQNAKIAAQKSEIEGLKRAIAAQEERWMCKVDELEGKILALTEENAELRVAWKHDQAEVARLRAKVEKYEKILLGGPAWAKKAALDAGLNERFGAE